MKTFNPTLAIPYIASNTLFIPSPWSQDPSATDNTTVVADASITPDGSNINLKVQDGWRWIQLGDPTHVYGYARTEINLTNQIGFTVFPAGVVTTFEWQGYFTTGLPAVLSGEPFVAPFQIHHFGGGSPPYALEVDTSDHLLYLYIHNIDGSFNRREVLMDFNDLVNVSTNIKANYKPNSAAGIADGSMQILIDGAEVFTESGVENCVVQNKDYAKVGIYDFTNAIVDPTDAGRGQSLEMVVENFSVYLAATPTRTHIDTSQAGVPVGGTTGQTLVKNSSDNFDYSWGTSGGTLQTVTDAGNTTTSSLELNSTGSGIFSNGSILKLNYTGSQNPPTSVQKWAIYQTANNTSTSLNISFTPDDESSQTSVLSCSASDNGFGSYTDYFAISGKNQNDNNPMGLSFDFASGSTYLTTGDNFALKTTSALYVWPTTPPTVGQVLTCTDDTGGVYTLAWQ